MVSQPTDQCSRHRHCCPPALIKMEWGGKKNGETTSYALTILHFFHSPFFQLNCHFLGERERSMISQPTDRCSPCRHYRPLAFIKTEQGGKKNGETTLYALTILHLIHSPFFNYITIFGVNAWSMVLQPTDRCLPPRHCCPHACIKTEQGCKENGEIRTRGFIFSFL